MNLATLRRRARANDLEVEHLLGIASERPEGLADELERLIAECHWTDGGEIRPGIREIPWRRWARTAIAYARDGFEGLERLLADDLVFHAFVHALLEQLHNADAVQAMLRIDAVVIADPASDIVRAARLAHTINSFRWGKPVQHDAPTAAVLRDYLHRLIPLCAKPADRATAVVALGAIGDASSLELLATQPPLEYPWESALKTAQREIRKHLKAESAASGHTMGNITIGSSPAGEPHVLPKKPTAAGSTSNTKLIVYDKAKWHADADDFPIDLPPEAAATHIAHYLRWCAQNDLLAAELCETYPQETTILRNSTPDACDFLLRELDGALDSTAFNPAGHAFTNAYYRSNRTRFARKYGYYLDDYERLAARQPTQPGANLRSGYDTPTDDGFYNVLASLISQRYAEYLSS